jgi:hypothetical protein
MARTAGYAAPALLMVLLALAPGCDLVTYRPPVGRDFGAPYVVRAGVPMNVAPGVVLVTPAIDAQRRLLTVVEYEGGCLPHSFAIQFDASASDATVVWLVHDDGGDRCEQLVRDTVAIDMGAAYRAGDLTLDTPSGDLIALRSGD